MKVKVLRSRLHLIACAILAIGLCCATTIYLTAGDDAGGASSYVVADGTVYAIPAATSKMYVRELQRFGGKTAVLFDELGTWFAGLWHGRKLAFTVVWISAAAALAVFLYAKYLILDPDSET